MRTTSRSSTTTKADRLAPVHPGEVLEQEFLIPMGLSAYRVAVDIGVAPPRINDILLQRRAITADTALRLAKYFGTSERFWLGLQADYDLDVERDRLAEDLARVPRFDREDAPIVRRPREVDATKRATGDAKLLDALFNVMADTKKMSAHSTVRGSAAVYRSARTGKIVRTKADSRGMSLTAHKRAKKK